MPPLTPTIMEREQAINDIISVTNGGSLEEWKRKIGNILDEYLLTGDKGSVKISKFIPINKEDITEELFRVANIYYKKGNSNGVWCSSYKEYLLKKDRFDQWLVKYNI